MSWQKTFNTPFSDDDDFFTDEDYEKEYWQKETLSDPRLIYEFLRTKVYGQDEACKAAALLLYTTVNEIQMSKVNTVLIIQYST